MLLTLYTDASKGLWRGESFLRPPSTREGQRLEEIGAGKGEMFWLAGSPLHSLGFGGGESLKCFQKMSKWSLPLEWLVTPLKPRAQ